MIKLFSKGLKHEPKMMNITQPPGRVLFKVNSRTYLAVQKARANIISKLG
jgi:hypothetical protein